MVAKAALNEGVERRTLSSQLYESLERKVVTGIMAPGTRLSEESLAEAYGVSRSPAREALAELERTGLAVKIGMRDRMITIPSADMIAQKYDVWWIIDVGRTYLSSQEATPRDIAELSKYMATMTAAIEADDAIKYREVAKKFHDKIRDRCSNRYIRELGGEYDMLIKWFETLYDRDPEISAMALAEHRHILAAYEARDLAALTVAIRQHVMRQRTRILRYFEGQGATER